MLIDQKKNLQRYKIELKNNANCFLYLAYMHCKVSLLSSTKAVQLLNKSFFSIVIYITFCYITFLLVKLVFLN